MSASVFANRPPTQSAIENEILKQSHTVVFEAHPVSQATVDVGQRATLARPLTSETVRTVFQIAMELREIRRKEEEARRKAVEAVRARFSAD